MFTFIVCYRVKDLISLFSNFLYCNFPYYYRFSIDSFQVFSTHNSNRASASACNAKSPKTLKTLQNQASSNFFCTLLQQLLQGHVSVDSKLLLPSPNRPRLLNRDFDPSSSPLSSSLWLLQSSLLHRFLPLLKHGCQCFVLRDDLLSFFCLFSPFGSPGLESTFAPASSCLAHFFPACSFLPFPVCWSRIVISAISNCLFEVWIWTQIWPGFCTGRRKSGYRLVFHP